jgi:hypothetical protein
MRNGKPDPVKGRAGTNAGRAGVGRHRKDDAPPPRRDRLVQCRDLAGRRGTLMLFADHGHVVLVVPDGETAVLTLPQVGQLRAALRDAIFEAASA